LNRTAKSPNYSQSMIDTYYSMCPKPLYDILMGRKKVKDTRKELFEHLSIAPDERVLEIASGTGLNFLFYLDSARHVALERNRSMIERSLKRASPEVSIVRGDASGLPFRDRVFDAAILAYALSSVPDSRSVLDETRRVLRPYGRLAVLDFKDTGSGSHDGLAAILNDYNWACCRQISPGRILKHEEAYILINSA
jgi:ubiquinone/menaquinone biosynthesis C-methylase UbiE